MKDVESELNVKDKEISKLRLAQLMIDKFCMLNAGSLDAQVIPLIGVVCL